MKIREYNRPSRCECCQFCSVDFIGCVFDTNLTWDNYCLKFRPMDGTYEDVNRTLFDYIFRKKGHK